jgi:hypothetical protein
MQAAGLGVHDMRRYVMLMAHCEASIILNPHATISHQVDDEMKKRSNAAASGSALLRKKAS